jgi:hypothetical protein
MKDELAAPPIVDRSTFGGDRRLAHSVLPGAPTASRRQSGRVGRNAASGRHVGQVCANGAATTLHPQFSWVGRVEEGRLAGTYRQPTVSIWSAAVSVVGASCCEILAG